MAHEFASHRNAETKRVGHLLKSGGVAHADAASDKKLISKMLKAHEKTEGEKHGGAVTGARLDRSYARSGKVKRADGGKVKALPKPPTLPILEKPDAFRDISRDTEAIGRNAGRGYARGGRTKKHKPSVQVNIIAGGGKDSGPAIPPPVVGLAGGPPDAAGGPLPVGGKPAPVGLLPPPGAAPPMAPAPAAMGPRPGMKRGGVVKRPFGGRTRVPTGVKAIRAPLSPMHPMRGLPMVGKRGGFKSGGSIPGEPTKANLSKWSARAASNSTVKRASGGRLTGGAETGVGRLEKAAKYRRGK